MVLSSEDLCEKLRELLQNTKTTQTEADLVNMLGISKSQAKGCLKLLVKEGAVKKLSKPVRYQAVETSGRLF